MTTPKKAAEESDAFNLFPEPKDCFHLRVPQHFLDLCEGDLLEALVLSKLCYWAAFEYKDQLRRSKRPVPDEIVVRRSITQLAGDCLGTIGRSSVKRKLRSLAARGFLRSEQPTLARSSSEQVVNRIVNVTRIQECLRDWERMDSPVRRTRFVRGHLEVKSVDGWAAFSFCDGRDAEGPGPNGMGDRVQMGQVPGPNEPGGRVQMNRGSGSNEPGLIKGEESHTPYGVKDSQRIAGAGAREAALAGGSGEDDRWVVEGVDFGPGSSRFHGSNLDQCSAQDFAQILKLFRLAQEFGYGIQIPAPGKRPPETFFTSAMILRDYQQRTWVPNFTPAFESAWGRPDTVGPARTWEEVEADLRDAFQHDLAQKAGTGRNPGPFVRFLEVTVADAGTSSQFWASLVQFRRAQRTPGPSAVLREQIRPEAMITLTRRFRDAPDRPRDPKVYWERCLQLQSFLTDHRAGIKVHAALVGGWFRGHPVDVAEVLDLYDMFQIEAGSRDPGDPGTGWPPVPGERDWDAFLAWGRGRPDADSFDLAHRPSMNEADADDARKAQEVERCFTRWRDDPEFYVDEEVVLDIVRRTAPHLRRLSPAMLVHAVRLIHARKACQKRPSGLHLRALSAEAQRDPSPKIDAQEEVVWALLGGEFMDSVRSYWEEHFPDKMDLPEAALFPNSEP